MKTGAQKKKELVPGSSVNPFGEFVYVTMLSLTEDGASILMLNTPIRDEIMSHYVAVLECDDIDLKSRNSVLWFSRLQKVESLLKPVLNHVSEGNYNNEIRDALVRICGAEHWTELGEEIAKLPDRTNCGNTESWLMSAIRLWAGEMQHWWGYMRVLRIDAARWALAKLKPTCCPKCRGEVWEISCPVCGNGG